MVDNVSVEILRGEETRTGFLTFKKRICNSDGFLAFKTDVSV
jgi:hypothetical protein